MTKKQPDGGQVDTTAGSVTMTDRERDFVEDFAEQWHQSGLSRIEGRIVGYLLISQLPKVSSAQLAEVLHAAPGAISMATRALVEQGFIRRHRSPGDRSHYFAADDDVWGGFLSGERRWVYRMEEVIDSAIATLDLTTAAENRLLIAVEYMRWLGSYNQQMLTDWRRHLEENVELKPVDDA